MTWFRRTVLVLAIPLTLVLIAWMVLGRALFGIMTGWSGVIVLFMVAPVVLICTTVSAILMLCQPARPVRLSAAQAWLQVACWASMFVAGIAIVDFDDGNNVGGILLSVLGDSPTTENICGVLLLVCGFVGAAAWLALLVLLIIGLTRKPPLPTRWYPPPAYGPWNTASTLLPSGSRTNAPK